MYYVAYQAGALNGALAWYTIISFACKERLEQIQRSASRIIYPDMCHGDRFPLLNSFIFGVYPNLFKGISSSPGHLLNQIIVFNNYLSFSYKTGTCSVHHLYMAHNHKISNSFPVFHEDLNNGKFYT